MDKGRPHGHLTCGPVAAVAVAAALVATAARAPAAVHKSLWADEVGSARAYTQPALGEAVERVRTHESTPPGWFTAAWGMERAALVADDRPLRSPKLPRALSVLAGALTAALVVVYARRHMQLWAAGLAGWLAALSYQLVEHGAEARAYELAALVVLIFALVLERAAARPTNRWLAALAVVTAVGAYTHYFVLLSVATGLVWLWTRAPPVARIRVTGAVGVGLATLLPWLSSMVHQVKTQHHSYINAFSVNEFLNLYPNTFARAGVWRVAGVAGRIALVTVVLAGALCLARRRNGQLCALLVVLPVVVSGAMWAAGARIVDTRNEIVAAPFAAIAVAAAVAAIPLPRLMSAAAVCVAVGIAAAFWLQTSEGRTPSDELAAGLVSAGWAPPDAVAVFAPYPEALALSWALPGHPEAEEVEPTRGTCAELFAVVETTRGRRWLHAHVDAVESRTSVPFFGFGPEGERHPVDAQVVRLRWSYGLARTVSQYGASLVEMGSAACSARL